MAAKISPFSDETETPMVIIEADDRTKRTKFHSSTEAMAKTMFPVINDNASVKVRLSTLESTVETQSEYNRLTLASFSNLSDNLNNVDLNLQDLLKQTQEHFTNVIAAMKKENDHK
jgi:hypothetical protein